MAIQNFSRAIKANIFNNWLNSLEKDLNQKTIIHNRTSTFRAKEQTAAKTSFYLTAKTLKDMIHTIGGIEISDQEANAHLDALLQRNPKDNKSPLATEVLIPGTNQRAVFYGNIGFETISEKIKDILYQYEEVEANLSLAEEQYYQAEEEDIKQKYAKLKKSLAKLSPKQEQEQLKKLAKQEQDELDRAEKRARLEGGLGSFFNKGHVVSVATNLVKRFRNQVNEAESELGDLRADMIKILDQYITRLEQDDLQTANLPDAINQEFYAKYVQNPNYYLVEFQAKKTNIDSGRASKDLINELRSIFGVDASISTIENILKKGGNKLGLELLTTPGSSSGLDIIVEGILSPFPGRKKPKTKTSPDIKVAQHRIKIKKPNNKPAIASLKKLKSKLAAVKSIPDSKQFVVDKKLNPPIENIIIPIDNTITLQKLLDANLVQTIKQNMGSGNRRDILNLRSGRFAESVRVDRISQSRQGAISVFYTYMRNPYATFSSGGRQQNPRSRDPKLLISSSIRQLAQQITQQRLRAVLV
jgi:hypothetical protein